jgi:hypothetical protein
VNLFCPVIFHNVLTAILLTGGFGSSLIAMDQRTYELIGPDYPGNRAEDVKNPGLGWMIGFMFVVSFLGLFSLVPLRKVIFLGLSQVFLGWMIDIARCLFLSLILFFLFKASYYVCGENREHK